eukprot:Nk52_evm1s1730 gene=Nk52_evmTU1s1730
MITPLAPAEARCTAASAHCPMFCSKGTRKNWFAEDTVEEARWIERGQEDICAVPNMLKCPTIGAFYLPEEGRKKVLRMEQRNNLSEAADHDPSAGLSCP